jgi:hypothetical protein
MRILCYGEPRVSSQLSMIAPRKGAFGCFHPTQSGRRYEVTEGQIVNVDPRDVAALLAEGFKPKPNEPVTDENLRWTLGIDTWTRYLPAITDAELCQLLNLVKSRYPKFVPVEQINGKTIEAFKVAFAWANGMRRGEEPNRQWPPGHWGEMAEEWAKSVQAPTRDVDTFVFAAAIAHGDVPFSLRSNCWGAAIGFVEAYGRGVDQVWITDPGSGYPILIKRDRPVWKEVLHGRPLREPDRPPEVDYDPSSIRRQPSYHRDHPTRWSEDELRNGKALP